jgi:hypothetical protein
VRKDAYLSAYAASVASAKRIERIESQLESEVERETELQQLVAKEYDSLTALEETLRTKQSPFDATVKLLQEQLAEDASRQLGAAAAARLPAALDPATYANATDWKDNIVALAKGSGKVTRTQLSLLREAAAAQTGDIRTVAEAAIKRIEGDKTRVVADVPTAPKPKPGQPSREQMVAQLAQMGEGGWKGGAAGQAFREGLSATQEKALQEYLRILGRGELPPEDHPGAPIYDQAVSVGGFQNRDVRLYTPTWVALRRRVTDLERKAEQASPEKRWSGRTAEQELVYRELKARGVDPDDKYFSLRGTPEYAVLKRAEEVGSVDLNRYPGGKAITEYIRQVEQSGQKLSLPLLVAQARKLEKDPAAATELAALALADANRRFLERNPPKAPPPQKGEESVEDKARREAQEQIDLALRKLKIEEERARSEFEGAEAVRGVGKARKLQAEQDLVATAYEGEDLAARREKVDQAKLLRALRQRKVTEAERELQARQVLAVDTRDEAARRLEAAESARALAADTVQNVVNERREFEADAPAAVLRATIDALKQQMRATPDGPEFDALNDRVDALEQELRALEGQK